jgi:hypothetical protein
MAETLGLNLDPTSWQLPAWETSLRIRVWWGVYVQEKCVVSATINFGHVNDRVIFLSDTRWIALGHGRPSHIKDEDWDVPLPEINRDWRINEPYSGEDDRVGAMHFIQMAKLSLIVSDMQRSLLYVFSFKLIRVFFS